MGAASDRAHAGAGRVLAGHDAARQRRHRHHGGAGRATHRARRARGERAARAGRRRAAALAARRSAADHRAVSRSRERSVERAPDARGSGAGRFAVEPRDRSRAPARCAGRRTPAIVAPITTSSARSSRRPKREREQIVYTVDTKRARSDVRPQPMQVPLVRNLVLTASNSAEHRHADRPDALQPARAGRSRAVHGQQRRDGARARREHGRHPVGGARASRSSRQRRQPPWSIRTKLLRKLREVDAERRPSRTPRPTTAFSSSAIPPAIDRSIRG